TFEQLREAEAAVGPRAAHFRSVQNQYSMLHREPEQGASGQTILEECAREKLAFLPYFPLENGLLTGKYRAGEPMPQGSRAKDGFGPKVFTEQNLSRVEKLNTYAQAHGHSLLDLAFSWLASREVVASVIAGAKNPVQVRANAAATSWKLTAGELGEIDAL